MMNAALLIASARRLARGAAPAVVGRTAVMATASSMNGMNMSSHLVARRATPSTSMAMAMAMATRALSTTKTPKGTGNGSDDSDNESGADSDDDEEDDDEDDHDEENEDASELRAAARAAFTDEDLAKFNSDDDDEWDAQHYGAMDSEDWQGFDGDLDAVTEEGVPKWLQSVRDLSAIHQEKRMRAKLARRAMEEAKMNVVRHRKVDELGRAYGTGRRKTSTARVWIKKSTTPFDGTIKINKKDLTEYFVRDTHREDVLTPFMVVGEVGNFDVYATVAGGGTTGQAGAVRHGISRALQHFDPSMRPLLKKQKLLMRDPRMVERKKPGQKKARKKFQWVKR